MLEIRIPMCTKIGAGYLNVKKDKISIPIFRKIGENFQCKKGQGQILIFTKIDAEFQCKEG